MPARFGPLAVRLSNRGNPDFGQDSSRPLPGTLDGGWMAVPDFQTASELCQAYIAGEQLGGGNWTGGEIRRTTKAGGVGKVVLGHVSYNGRVWSADGDTEITWGSR